MCSKVLGKSVLFIVLILALFTKYSYGLSDAEYNYFMRHSSEFKIFDEELGNTWKQLMILAKHDRSFRQAALNEQRQWVNHGRDKLAKKFMKMGIDSDLAYAKATSARINELMVDLYNMRLSEDEIRRGAVRSADWYAEQEDDPEYYLDHSTNRLDVIQSFCRKRFFSKQYRDCRLFDD